ncbi:hypothetical protein [Streptomyces fulvorobeus]|uniref:Uncharacterized protein n=1 Tax=Streptomyces fulvorobeus TaxID=284028 RepID=A0A7J0C0G0_9ACTN|nr:hypothetical protein [Streptomyces fulvorobeus]NYE39226.1 hypothetical protein [Streptomyces fulvorobeus]GFM95433.1 hypothetical protein Sfulv_02440 [Streptomyces fulvorobeus]
MRRHSFTGPATAPAVGLAPLAFPAPSVAGERPPHRCLVTGPEVYADAVTRNAGGGAELTRTPPSPVGTYVSRYVPTGACPR